LKMKILSMLIPFLLLLSIHAAFAWEVDATTTADRVIDGDTFDTTTEGRIRLADVDAPERGESGYYTAENLLDEFVSDKTVYLDIDDIYRTGPYGRLICVVYVNHNSTHLMNVNKALLLEGAVAIDNYDNEFNPYTWTLYVQRLLEPQNPSTDQDSWHAKAIVGFLASVGIIATIICIAVMRKK